MFSPAKNRIQQKERIANIAKTNPTRHSQIERYFESGSSMVLLRAGRGGVGDMRKKVASAAVAPAISEKNETLGFRRPAISASNTAATVETAT